MPCSLRRSVPRGNTAQCVSVIELPPPQPRKQLHLSFNPSALMNLDWSYGLIHLGFWSYVWLTLAMVQTTMMAVTVYLHRDATHRSLDLHPALRHFFRFWIWFTSSMLTREWVA